MAWKSLVWLRIMSGSVQEEVEMKVFINTGVSGRHLIRYVVSYAIALMALKGLSHTDGLSMMLSLKRMGRNVDSKKDYKYWPMVDFQFHDRKVLELVFRPWTFQMRRVAKADVPGGEILVPLPNPFGWRNHLTMHGRSFIVCSYIDDEINRIKENSLRGRGIRPA
jgi:hypothetical protein